MLGLVTFADDPGWHHERLFLYPVTTDRWVLLTGDGDLYDEDLSWYSSAEELTRAGYPPGVTNVVAFSETLMDSEVLDYIKQGRGEARRVRAAEGLRPPFDEPHSWVDWDGRRRELPEDGLIDGLRRRLRSKTTATRPNAPLALEDASPSGPAPGTSAGVPDPTPGHVWVVCDPLHPAFGETRDVHPDEDPTGLYAFLDCKGEMIPWRRMPIGDLASYQSRCRDALRRDEPSPAALRRAEDAPAKASGQDSLAVLRDRLREPSGEKPDSDGEDVRTLAVDFDEHGFRWKSWHDVVGEMSQSRFDDWSKHLPEGTPIAKDMLVNFERIGGDPRRWLQEWLRDRGLGARERTSIEMKVIVDTVHFAGCYDQLNLPSLLCVEVLLRRAAQIIEAYDGDPARPNWAGVRYMMGETHALNPVPFQMKAYNARKLKEEAEIEGARRKGASTTAGGADPPTASGEEGGADATGGGGSATRRSRRTRKLGAAAEG